MKKGTAFLLGIIAGILLALAILTVISKSYETSEQQNFKAAEQKMPFTVSDKFKVFQVIENGALAISGEKGREVFIGPTAGPTVYIIAEGENQFYDDQIVTVPEGKKAVQIGTYKYTTRSGSENTVPVIIFE